MNKIRRPVKINEKTRFANSNLGSFPGALPGLKPNKIHRLSKSDNKMYIEEIKNRGWRPERWRKSTGKSTGADEFYRKGDDSGDYKTMIEPYGNNLKVEERYARHALEMRAQAYRPHRKDIGMQQLEIPRYSRIKAPISRNYAKMWETVLKDPAQLKFDTFNENKNVTRTFKPNKYIKKFIQGVDPFWFNKKYMNKAKVVNEKTYDYSVRNPFTTDINMKSTNSKGSNINALTIANGTKFSKINPKNRYIRKFIDFNNSTSKLKKQTIFDTTGIKNEGNTSRRMPEETIKIIKKLKDRKNYNEEKWNTPYKLQLIEDKRNVPGSVLDRSNMESKDTLAKHSDIPYKVEKGTFNKVKFLPDALIKNYNKHNAMMMKFHNRDNGIYI